MSSAAVVIGALRVICKATHGLCSKLHILDRGIPLGAVHKLQSEKTVLSPLQTQMISSHNQRKLISVYSFRLMSPFVNREDSDETTQIKISIRCLYTLL